MQEITKANLLGIFIEGALVSEGRMHNCALHALNTHLGVFRGHKGKFTTDQAAKLLEAAGRYVTDPVNQISLTRPILLSGSRERA